MQRLKHAQRNADTLQARTAQALPLNYDEEMASDVDAMAARYAELRVKVGHDADRTCRVECVQRILGRSSGGA